MNREMYGPVKTSRHPRREATACHDRVTGCNNTISVQLRTLPGQGVALSLNGPEKADSLGLLHCVNMASSVKWGSTRWSPAVGLGREGCMNLSSVIRLMDRASIRGESASRYSGDCERKNGSGFIVLEWITNRQRDSRYVTGQKRNRFDTER